MKTDFQVKWLSKNNYVLLYLSYPIDSLQTSDDVNIIVSTFNYTTNTAPNRPQQLL